MAKHPTVYLEGDDGTILKFFQNRSKGRVVAEAPCLRKSFASQPGSYVILAQHSQIGANLLQYCCGKSFIPRHEEPYCADLVESMFSVKRYVVHHGHIESASQNYRA